jgi:site-specific DNA recombinase
MIYNKTEQLKELRDESTIAHPVYVRKGIRRGVGDWIISVGRHGGIIAGRDWVLVQKILEDNRDRHKRPKEKTQSLLSGLIACPVCGKNMYVHRETGRLTDGKPRFLYKCQTKRSDKSACSCRDVKGNAIDRFVLDAVCSMGGEWEDEYYRLLEEDTLAREKTDGIKTGLLNIDKMIDRCRNEIQNQTKSLRLASEASREFIMEDMNKLMETLKQYEADKRRLLSIKESRKNETETVEKAKKLISSFSCLMEELTYREKAEFLRIAVERVYVLPGEAGDDKVHIFMKGAPAKSLAGGSAGAQ